MDEHVGAGLVPARNGGKQGTHKGCPYEFHFSAKIKTDAHKGKETT